MDILKVKHDDGSVDVKPDDWKISLAIKHILRTTEPPFQFWRVMTHNNKNTRYGIPRLWSVVWQTFRKSKKGCSFLLRGICWWSSPSSGLISFLQVNKRSCCATDPPEVPIYTAINRLDSHPPSASLVRVSDKSTHWHCWQCKFLPFFVAILKFFRFNFQLHLCLHAVFIIWLSLD